MARLCFFTPLVSFLLLASFLSAQSLQQSNPEALNLAVQSIAVLGSGTSISDATLTGTAIWSITSKSETANATLTAKGFGKSRFDIELSAGRHSEIRNDEMSSVLGESIGSDGFVLQWDLRNCLTNATWFLPQLSALGDTTDSTLIFSYVGQESRKGVEVQHIQSYRYWSKDTADVQKWSKTDIYLDAETLFPRAFAFNTHSTDGSHVVPVEVEFSNYQAVSGIRVPFRIQRYVSGDLLSDFKVTNAQFNTGLPDSQFDIPQRQHK
jgi:hypothetical protein